MLALRRAFLWILVLLLPSVKAERFQQSLPLSKSSDSLQQQQQQYHHPQRQLLLPESSSDKNEVGTVEFKQRSSAWPPWPFNLVSRSSNNNSNEGHHHSSWNRAWQHTRESLKVAARNTQQLSSSLYMHLPPAAHPFLLMASIPYRKKIPLLADPFARSIGFAAVGVAIVSWAHCGWHRRRSLVPLPLAHQYRDVHRAILPPFLPDEVILPWSLEHHKGSTHNHNDDQTGSSAASVDEQQKSEKKAVWIPRRLQQHWNLFSASNKTSTKWPFQAGQWQKTRKERHFERLQERRRAVYDELVALQTLKQKRVPSSLLQKFKTIAKTKKEEDPEEPLGYALVTGASRGIGRAIAVELARWEIPLILVARNVDRLIALANDLENCYGVKCCVLEADLSKPQVAERVYKTTQDAGLRVDILVNNAGMSSHGIAVDQPVHEVNQMLQLNACSSAILSNLFGHDMKQRRRGRILFVSSVSGTVAGISSVALYSATKAFQNSLAVAMAKEMEPCGVGVTCLMPGAVEDTDFSKTSKTDQALCWKLPFYPKKPHMIAKAGVRAMLQGETEVVPGWQNRLFVKVLKPVLPQRLHNVIAETVWNPLRFPFQKSHINTADAMKKVVDIGPGPSSHVFSQFGSERLPRLLLLDPEPSENEDKEHGAEQFDAPYQGDANSTAEPSEDSQ